MSFDYEALRSENQRRYGTDIGRVGDLLLGKRYAERTHFIFELLQNAEDALARRSAGWTGSRSIRFEVTNSGVRVSHFGDPFNERDVRGICAIGQGTKDLTDIGEFGIGFKSVYAVTDRPEVYSGDHAFAVERYVLPVELRPVDRDSEETVFILPFEPDDSAVFQDVVRGLHRLSSKALLFLREIEEIRWSVETGASGGYVRKSKRVGEEVRRVTVIEMEEGEATAEDTWLVFSRPVDIDEGTQAVGFAEIAFRTRKAEGPDNELLQSIEQSPLVVYFPTVVETHLGFLLQGPYRTTPSRDNIPPDDSWNSQLIDETGELLVGALRWLRDHDHLDAAALRCLPLDGQKLSETHEGMFMPLFDTSKQALSSEPLLPRQGGGHVPAGKALLAGTGELRDLLDPRQLKDLLGNGERRWWVTDEITRDRTRELHRYLREELEVPEITPKTFVSQLKKTSFLEAQPDAWIRDLYSFLDGHTRLRRRFDTLPLVRLEDGSHVLPHIMGEPQAYLPGRADTNFPTVRRTVCNTDESRGFLRSLGLSEPDPVDDVLRNILPKYEVEEPDISDEEYEADIGRIVEAYGTDSESRRKKLVSKLEDTPFVRVVDAGTSTRQFSRAGDVYIATERLKQLFADVRKIHLVDDSYSCLRGEHLREVLKAAGGTQYLRPLKRTGLDSLSHDKRKKLREEAGHPKTSGQNDKVVDWEIHGLEELLELLPHLDVEHRQTRAELLWEALAQLEGRRGKGVFEGTYSWTHHGTYEKEFDAKFVQRLNTTPWIPDSNGGLKPPEVILFSDLGWDEHPFLQSKIQFRTPILDELAEEAGIDPGVLNLLKEVGVTSEADLRERLNLGKQPGEPGEEGKQEEEQPDQPPLTSKELGNPAPIKPNRPVQPEGKVVEEVGGASVGDDVNVQEPGAGGRTVQPASPPHPDAGEEQPPGGGGPRGAGPPGDSPVRRRFVSYVAVYPDKPEFDPDGLEREKRMELEEKALQLILSREPDWHRTPPGNPGFDLYKTDSDGKPEQWCEVKAMTGDLDERPVTMSRTQFEHANREGESYWLYVVEYAETEQAQIVPIRDPAGKAQYFTFDRGWRAAADEDRDN